VKFEGVLGSWKWPCGDSESPLLLQSIVLGDKGIENRSDKEVQDSRSS
jgi:hypothetical protein